jgi:hypothetical protein
MARREVAHFDMSDRALAKAAAHGISERQLYAVLDNGPYVLRNRRDRAAQFIVLGWDDGGRCLAIPVLPTNDPIVWQPITAWYCKLSEEAILRRWRSP